MKKKLVLGLTIGAIALILVGVIIVLIFGMCDAVKDKNTPASYSEGDIVKIPIKVSENPGMMIAKTVINYDDTVLEYIECENGFFTDNTVIIDSGTASCLLMTADANNTTKTGTAATLVFKVKKGVKPGDYFFSIDQKNSEYANIREKFVTPKVSVTDKIIIE